MTALERDILRDISAGRPTAKGRPPRKLRALESAGYIAKAQRDTVFGKRAAWAVTDAGRAALAPRRSGGAL